MDVSITDLKEQEYPYGVYVLTVSTGFRNAVHTTKWDVSEDYTEEEWGGFSRSRKEDILYEATSDYADYFINYSYSYQKKKK